MKKHIEEWGLSYIILVMGLVDLIVAYFLKSTVLSSAITLTLLLFLLERLHAAQKEIRKLMDLAQEQIFFKEDETVVKDAIERDQGLIGKAIIKTLRRFHKPIRVIPGGFELKNHFFALDSYIEFWDALVEEQKMRPKKNPLKAKVIHSCTMAIWNDVSFKPALTKQGEFIKAHGEIMRILCGNGKIPSDVVCAAAKTMKKYKISVFYYDIDSGSAGYDLTWDFLYICELDKAAIWTSVNPGGKITGAIYTNNPYHNGEHLQKTFDRIRPITEFLDDGTLAP